MSLQLRSHWRKGCCCRGGSCRHCHTGCRRPALGSRGRRYALAAHPSASPCFSRIEPCVVQPCAPPRHAAVSAPVRRPAPRRFSLVRRLMTTVVAHSSVVAAELSHWANERCIGLGVPVGFPSSVAMRISDATSSLVRAAVILSLVARAHGTSAPLGVLEGVGRPAARAAGLGASGLDAAGPREELRGALQAKARR